MISLTIRYYMNKTDQNAIANARLDGLEEDLGLTGNQFNVAVSILYAGYTCVQIPSNLMMSSGKVRPSRWMAGWMLAWAVVSACTAAVNNYTGLVIVRLLLGFTEVTFHPLSSHCHC
jgi:MFS family permease